MSLNLRQIEVFRAVMTTGSISGAAQILHVSQPAVSRLLSYTEGKIGFALFERIKGRLYATPEAKRLFREVEHVYSGVQRVNELAHELAERRGGALHVMSSPSIGQWVIPQAIAEFRLAHADVHITLGFQNYLPMRDLLLEQKADIGIVILPMDHPKLEVTAIGSGRMVCACPPQHPLARRGTLALRELRPFEMIRYDPDSPFGAIVGQMYALAGETLVSNLEVGSPQNACALVAMGAGIALVDEFSARSWPASQIVACPIAAAVNQFVATIKATSLGYIIGLTEVSFIAAQINTQVFTRAPEVYGLLALAYFVLCFGLSRLAQALEPRRGGRPS